MKKQEGTCSVLLLDFRFTVRFVVGVPKVMPGVCSRKSGKGQDLRLFWILTTAKNWSYRFEENGIVVKKGQQKVCWLRSSVRNLVRLHLSPSVCDRHHWGCFYKMSNFGENSICTCTACGPMTFSSLLNSPSKLPLRLSRSIIIYTIY